MNLELISTNELEARDERLTRNRLALISWNNRSLGQKARKELIENIRAEQKRITEELIKREGANA